MFTIAIKFICPTFTDIKCNLNDSKIFLVTVELLLNPNMKGLTPVGSV